MDDILLWFFSAILAITSVGTFFFQDSIRCAASTGVAIGSLAALMALGGATLASALFLLAFAGSILLFLLMTSILLHIHPDEWGTRRLSIQSIVITGLLAYLASAFLGFLAQPAAPKRGSTSPELSLQIGKALFEDYGFILGITALVFLSAITGVFLIARRRI